MRKAKNLSNEEILAMEARGEDPATADLIQGTGKMMPAREAVPMRAGKKDEPKLVARVNVDFTPEVLAALDLVTERLGINRQASIKEAVLMYVDHKILTFERQKAFLGTKK